MSVRLLFCLLIYDCTNGCVFSELLSSMGNAEQWKCEGVKMSCACMTMPVVLCCIAVCIEIQILVKKVVSSGVEIH